ncbi:MAG: DegT/DnrJ/EryC1/StrS family aminotransferase [Woeseiaceae bacterium]
MTSENRQRDMAPWPSYSQQEIDAVSDVLSGGKVNYWTGEENRSFEKEFAEYCETRYAVAVANGTVALQLGLQAASIGPGDEVIVTPRSFIASASCVVLCGATPVFADVDPVSQNITAETARAVLTPATRAIIAVHHAGWPCEMDELMALADEHNLVIVEDCAQAHGASYKGKMVGGIGHFGAFSFCQDKIITTGGEGGMIVTNDADIWQRTWSYKDHGKSFDAVFKRSHKPGFRWLHESFGSNERMTEMQAAIGRIQIRKLPQWRIQRARNAQQLSRVLGVYEAVTIPDVPDHIEHAFYRFYVTVDSAKLADGWDRDRIADTLNRKGVPVFSGSCPEIYREKAFDQTSFRPSVPLSAARKLGDESLAFLVHPTLTESDMCFVCDTIEAVMAEASVSTIGDAAFATKVDRSPAANT